MKPVSLADISYEQGLKLLLLRKQALDEGSVQRMPPAALANTFVMNSTGTQVIKQAAGLLDQLKALPGQASDWAKGTYSAGLDKITTDPGLRNTIGYSLAGAGLGALGAGGLAASRKEKDWKRRLLQGATAGGLLGGGLGFVLNPGSVTDNIASGVEERTKKLLSTGEPTDEQKRQDIVNAYKDTSGSNPALGATVPAGIGAASSVGLNKVLSWVPGLKPVDRLFIAEQLIDDYIDRPSNVNTGRIESLVDTSSLKPKAPIVSTATKTQQGFVDSLFDAKPAATNTAMPTAPTEAAKQQVIAELKSKLPLGLAANERSLAKYISDAKQRAFVAEQAKNPGFFSVASSRGLLAPNFARRGIASIPAIIGTLLSLKQYQKDLAAQQQARDALNWARLNKPAPAANPSFMDLWKDEITKRFPLPNARFTPETSTLD